MAAGTFYSAQQHGLGHEKGYSSRERSVKEKGELLKTRFHGFSACNLIDEMARMQFKRLMRV